jgi:hypothetical protein
MSIYSLFKRVLYDQEAELDGLADGLRRRDAIQLETRRF